MKRFFISALLSLSLVACFDSKQDNVTPEQSKIQPIKLRSTNALSIDSKHQDFIAISKLQAFRDYQKSALLDLNNINLIEFSNSVKGESKAIVISVKSNNPNNESNNLVISYKKDFSSYSFLLLEREGASNVLGMFSGTNRLKTLDKQILSEELIQNNKSIKVITYMVDEKSVKNARQNSCSYAEFNFYYQTLKSNCSDDAACDIVCAATGPICAFGMALQANDLCWAFDYNP